MLRQREQRDGFTGIGTVQIRPFKLTPDGKKTYSPVKKNNMIVETGRGTLIDLLTGTRNRVLSYIRWGKGGALSFPDGDPLNPLPVSDKDTDVGTFLLDKPLSPFNRLSVTQVEYIETLICDEVNDDVNEAIMMFEDKDTMERTIFSRITFPTVRLTIEQGTGIEIRWIFNFAKAGEVPVDYEEEIIDTPPDEDNTAPAEVTNLQEVHTATTVTLSFTPPTDIDYIYANVYRDGVLIAEGIADNTWTDSNLAPATTYGYRVTTVDENLNQSEGVQIAVRTS